MKSNPLGEEARKFPHKSYPFSFRAFSPLHCGRLLAPPLCSSAPLPLCFLGTANPLGERARNFLYKSYPFSFRAPPPLRYLRCPSPPLCSSAPPLLCTFSLPLCPAFSQLETAVSLAILPLIAYPPPLPPTPPETP
ncbi:MAG: hypothetical protein OT477_02705 [Chloroflexi bacterium]|nr:hypothetical protein [Chloroflexota bacterium]